VHHGGVMNVRDSFNAAQSHAIQVHLDAQLSHIVRVAPRSVGFEKLTTAVLAHMRSLRRPFLTVSVELQFGHFISLFCHSHPYFFQQRLGFEYSGFVLPATITAENNVFPHL